MSILRYAAMFVCLGLVLLSGMPGTVKAQDTTPAASGSETAGRGFANPDGATPKAAWGKKSNNSDNRSAFARPKTQATSSWWLTILAMQQNFFRQMGEALKSFKDSGSLAASWALITISFLYGIFHAAGPGHGKAVISSYVLANGTTMRRGVALSFASGLMQALSAITIVSIFAVALNATGIEIKLVAQRFEIASGVLITLAGFWLLTNYLWRRFRVAEPALAHENAGHGPDHSHHNDENCGCGHAHMPDPRELDTGWSLRKAATIVMAVGIRPCSGAIFILIFALTQGLYWAGILSTFAMALGTAITVSALAIGAVLFRSVTLRYASSRWTSALYDITAIAGSCLVILFGAGLLLSSLGPARPF